MLKARQLLLVVLYATPLAAQVPSAAMAPTTSHHPIGQLSAPAIAQWPLGSFDRFTRFDIGKTARPWLNLLGNGLFGGHLILLLSNRGDGREFRLDTAHSAITHTDLHLDGLAALQNTTHGIGYSSFTFGSHRDRTVHLTYFLEPDDQDSEIWLIDNAVGARLTLRYGSKSMGLDHSVAFRIASDRIEQISSKTARQKLSAAKQTWERYLRTALAHMGVRTSIQPVLQREFVWDVYQVVAMLSSDQFSNPTSSPVRLRIPNMGGTYTVLGLDVHGRDSLQMIPALSRSDPALAREALLNLARYTDKRGRVCHRRLLSGQPIDRGHSDESYWLVIALIDYLQITHDLSILEARIPYLENDLLSEYVLFNDPLWVRRFDAKNLAPARFTAEETSMLEHARRALKDLRLGAHDLPLMEDGDWNDALNGMQKSGESVMNAGLYAYCLLQLSDLWRRLGREKVDTILGAGSFERDLQEFSQNYDAIKRAVNAHAWDGQWYVRGFDDRGIAFGSHENPEGRFYLNAQSWLILAGIPDEQRMEIMVRSVNHYLRKADKVSLLTPVYTQPDDNIGNITHLPRGGNENGGQWRQCTLWWIAALRKMGKQADALLLFDQLLLANADPQETQTEAYLYNEYLRGPEASDPGSGGQQAHVQQAALVLAMLAELYPQVKVPEILISHYDFPAAKVENQLYSFTGSGEKVPWVPKWVVNPAEYRLSLLSAAPAATDDQH